MTSKTKWILVGILLTATNLPADDGAASIAAGGIVVMGRETRITMAKEILQISASNVVVDYDFRNNTGGDVTTEVAFPIPPTTCAKRREHLRNRALMIFAFG